MNPAKLVWVGFGIILVGFAVTAIGAFVGTSGSSSGGGFILIGPFPIVFGSGQDSGMLATVGVATTVVMIAVYLISFILWRSAGRREGNAGTKSG